MNDLLKKRISIGVSVCCLSLAIGITIKTNFGGGYGSSEPVQMLCVNPNCGQTFKVSEEEFGGIASQSPVDETMTAAPKFKCLKCGQQTAYIAIKCKKCKKVFVPDYNDPNGFDRCSQCGFCPSRQ